MRSRASHRAPSIRLFAFALTLKPQTVLVSPSCASTRSTSGTRKSQYRYTWPLLASPSDEALVSQPLPWLVHPENYSTCLQICSRHSSKVGIKSASPSPDYAVAGAGTANSNFASITRSMGHYGARAGNVCPPSTSLPQKQRPSAVLGSRVLRHSAALLIVLLFAIATVASRGANAVLPPMHLHFTALSLRPIIIRGGPIYYRYNRWGHNVVIVVLNLQTGSVYMSCFAPTNRQHVCN